jgi:AhpD family alkylhydroperoxidase
MTVLYMESEHEPNSPSRHEPRNAGIRDWRGADLAGWGEGQAWLPEAFRSRAGFSPAEQETVFLTISRVNGCTYCTAAHSMIADKKSGVPAESLMALRNGRPLPDKKLQAVATFTEAMVVSRGNPGRAAVDAFLSAGYTEQHVLGVVLAIACKTFSNYVNHLGGTPVDTVFAPYRVD